MRQVRQDDPRWQWAHFGAASAGWVSGLAGAIHRTILPLVAGIMRDDLAWWATALHRARHDNPLPPAVPIRWSPAADSGIA
jgi:hypothetical protein